MYIAELTNDSNVPYLIVGFNQYREPTQDDDGDWYIYNRSECNEYNSDMTLDFVWTFAKVCSFLSLVFGGAGALFLWFSTCFQFSKSSWRGAGYEVSLNGGRPSPILSPLSRQT